MLRSPPWWTTKPAVFRSQLLWIESLTFRNFVAYRKLFITKLYVACCYSIIYLYALCYFTSAVESVEEYVSRWITAFSIESQEVGLLPFVQVREWDELSVLVCFLAIVVGVGLGAAINFQGQSHYNERP